MCTDRSHCLIVGTSGNMAGKTNTEDLEKTAQLVLQIYAFG